MSGRFKDQMKGTIHDRKMATNLLEGFASNFVDDAIEIDKNLTKK